MALIFIFATIFALIPCVGALPGQAVIYSISPTAGSLNGGTRLTILGAGFQRDNITGV
jgi:hypothetical protein